MQPHRPRDLDAFLRPGGRSRIIAHRGLSGLAPENTLPAFVQALELGVDMIELDVLMSADRELVVIHDAELERTTDGRGEVARRTLAELRALDAGSWFSPAFAGARIPTLGEVFDRLARKVLINVEIKSEAVSDSAEGGVVERVLRLVHERRLEREVLVSSFDERALHQARHLAPAVRIAALCRATSPTASDPVKILARTGALALFLAVESDTSGIVERCHAHGAIIGIYTVNEPELAVRLLERGVDALFTDRPDLLLESVERWDRRSGP